MLIDNKRTTVVIIDDDAFQQKIIKDCLKDEPYKIISILHGEPALTFLLRNQPDLILLDINMPDFSGIEILQRIKSYKHLSGVPIIMVTSDQTRDTILECIRKGATNYIVKPFTQSLLIEKVSTALKNATVSIENHG